MLIIREVHKENLAITVARGLISKGYTISSLGATAPAKLPWDNPLKIFLGVKYLGVLHFSDRTNPGANENNWVVEVEEITHQEEKVVQSIISFLTSTFGVGDVMISC